MTRAWRRAFPSLSMRPTRRGVGAVVVLTFAFAMAWQYGLRSLHAIMIPLAVVLLAALITVVRVAEPTVHRRTVEEGFLSEQRTVELTVDVDRPIPATLDDAVGDGLTAVGGGNAAKTMLDPDGRFSYEVTFDERGAHRLGPLTITVTDVLGLSQRRFHAEETTSVVVYPQLYDLRNGNERHLRLLADLAEAVGTEEFDHLREYVRGDSIRHVHWKTAAKRADEDLMIREFESAEELGAATVAAECAPGCDEEMATAAASAVTYLLQLGLSVGLSLPDADLPPAAGRDHHRAVLRSLAVAGSGHLDARIQDRADVVVRATPSETTVVIGDREIPFDRLRGARVDDTGDRNRPGDRNRRPGRSRSSADDGADHRRWSSAGRPGRVPSNRSNRVPSERHSSLADETRGVGS